ncbi:MAG: M28 family metallopeptidase [Promethearchaeota archaeon]|jgi:hypothetical protein
MIDEKRILENIKEFSFERLSGSMFEKRSFEIAKKKIEALNLAPSVQEFSFSTFYSRVYPKLSILLLFWLLLILFLRMGLIFTFVNVNVILGLLLILVIITRNPEKIKFGKIFNSQNLFIKVDQSYTNINLTNKPIYESREITKNILLFCHLDSKGQLLSIKSRIIAFRLWIYSFPISLLVIILRFLNLSEVFLFLNVVAILFLIINGFATVLILSNTTNNRSKGSIDNASGVSCVLELLHYFMNTNNRLKNVSLWFVFTGAEESGTMGVRNFFQHIKNCDRKTTYFINFDSIAKKVVLYNQGLISKNHPRSHNFILENNDLMCIEKAKKIYIGTYSDGVFLINKNLQGLGNGDKSSYNYIHSINDDIDKVDISFLKKLCQFYAILLSEVDSEYSI